MIFKGEKPWANVLPKKLNFDADGTTKRLYWISMKGEAGIRCRSFHGCAGKPRMFGMNSNSSRVRDILAGLLLHEPCVCSATREKFVMNAILNNAPFFHHEYAVSSAYS